MKLILLSGGSGKRLWPLSNDTRSKQFLKVLEGEEKQKESMVQRVWRQLESVNLTNSSIIATSKIQSEMIYSQIGLDVPLIIEPERRDTFPAIALATSYLNSSEKLDRDEVVVVLPVDPYVENKFFQKVTEIELELKKSGADLALIGVKPTYPSSKYGYIIPKIESDKTNLHVNVDYFIEKPSELEAQSLIEANALWNCGVFGFKLGYLLDILEEKGIRLDYQELYDNYSDLPKISFDYEVVEKAEEIIALPYNGYWKDLGTWNTLTEEMSSVQMGKGIISDSNNTHLVNELDIPVTIVGLNDVIVAASPDGILVSEKTSSPKIKDMISNFDQKIMYEERLWGWSKVLDYASYPNGQEMVTKRICILEGKNSSYHYHSFRDEVWTIVKGEGELALDDSITRVKAGDIIHLPSGKKHGIKAISELEFIEVQTGIGINDSDFTRLYFDWIEVIEQFNKTKSKVII